MPGTELPTEQTPPGSASRASAARLGGVALPAVAAVALLVLAGLMLWSQQRVPEPRPASAVPTDFSAERAVTHLDVIAQETRYVGSPNHLRARDYIVNTLGSLGLRPQLQRTAVVNRFSAEATPGAGTVTNVVARIPGSGRGGTIALNAHYDSGAGGPGASDCGGCVATLLEAARALKAGRRLRNDVLLVFTDSEENGDLGAAAFAGQSPLIRGVDVVLNWETAGSHGPSWLVGSNSSWLVQRVLAGESPARAYSLLPSLLRGLFSAQQLNTDTQEYMDRGVAGVQFVYMRGTTDYHTVLDNTERLGRGSLQMSGDYAVGLVRELGDTRVSRRVGDRNTYFNATGGVIVQYGAPVALGLAVLLVALVVFCLIAGLRRHLLTARGLALGVIVFPLATLVTTVITVITWLLIKRAVPDLRVFSLGSNQNLLFSFGLVALSLAVFGALYQALLRRARADNLALGALLWWTLLSVGFALASPSSAYLFTIPALAAAAAALWRLGRAPSEPWVHVAGAALPLAVLVVVYAPAMLMLTLLAIRLDGLGVPALGVMGLFAALAAGLFVPYIGVRVRERGGRLLGTGWLAPAAALVLAAILLVAGVARLGFDANYPRPDFISYVYDADRGAATWEAGDRDSWTRPLLRRASRASIELAPFSTVEGWRAPARRLELAGPQVKVLDRASADGATRVRLRLRSRRRAPVVAVHIRAGRPIASARIEGQRFPLSGAARRGELKLPYVGVPARGVTLTLRLRGHGSLRASARDYTQGLPPQLGLRSRPRDTMPAALSLRADPTVVVKRHRLRF